MYRVLLPLTVCATLLAGTACERSPNAAVDPLRIGAVASLTGAAGEQGLNWVKGADLAAKELNKSGIAVKLVVEDDQTNPSKSVRAYNKLRDVDRVQAVIGGTWDYLGESLYPLADRDRLPLITPSNPHELISPEARASRWVMSNGLSLRAARYAANEFLQAEQVKTLGLLYPNLPFGTAQADMFRELSGQLGIEIVFDLRFSYDSGYQDTVRLGVRRLKQHAPDLTFAVLDYELLDVMTKEATRLQHVVKFLTTQHLHRAFAFSDDPSRYQGAYGIYPLIQDQSFKERFRAHHGEDPQVYSAHGYDAVRFLVSTLRSGVFADPAAGLEYKGIVGTYRYPTKGGPLVTDRAVVMTTRDGVFEAWKP